MPVQRADATDKGGVMIWDVSVIMTTLVVMNTIETVMVVNTTHLVLCAFQEHFWTTAIKSEEQDERHICQRLARIGTCFFNFFFFFSHSAFAFWQNWLRMMQWYACVTVSKGHTKCMLKQFKWIFLFLIQFHIQYFSSLFFSFCIACCTIHNDFV